MKPDLYEKTFQELCAQIHADIEYFRTEFMFKGILKSVITVLTGYVSYVAKTVALMIGMGFVS